MQLFVMVELAFGGDGCLSINLFCCFAVVVIFFVAIVVGGGGAARVGVGRSFLDVFSRHQLVDHCCGRLYVPSHLLVSHITNSKTCIKTAMPFHDGSTYQQQTIN